jgi:hypothetical protein
MRVLIIHKDKGLRAAAARKISTASSCLKATVAKCADANGEWYDHDIVSAILEYDLIVLPLTLAHYGSLRFAELAHLTNAPCRLVLLSATRAPGAVLSRVFDGVVDSLDVTAIMATSKKVRTLSHIQSAIAAILEEADCFHWVDGQPYDAKRQVGTHTNPDKYLHVPDFPAYRRARESLEEQYRAGQFVFFCSYSHSDEALHEHFMKHAASIVGFSTMVWHDRMIAAGTDWAKEINDQIDKCDVFLAFVSADFLASRYCYGIELAHALGRHEKDHLRIIPIMLRPCYWQKTPLGIFKALPKDGRPVTSWRNQDKAFAEIAEALSDVVEEIVFQGIG